MPEWVDYFSLYFGWLATASIFVFLASIFLVSFLVVRMPSDYFLIEHKAGDRWKGLPFALQCLILLFQQLIGCFLILMGVLMLALPGQGVLTILIGVMLTRFPGKPRLMLWLIQQPGVLRSINWIRRRAGKAPLAFAQ